MKLTYTIPEGPNDITIGMLQAINALPDMAPESHAKALLKIVCGIPTTAVDSLPSSLILEAFTAVDLAIKGFATAPKSLPESITLGGTTYHLRDFNGFTFGEYADLETHLKSAASSHKAVAVAYQVKGQPYKGTAHADIFLKAPATLFTSAAHSFRGFIERIREIYPEVFAGGSSHPAEIEFGMKWGWYPSILAVAQGNPLNFDKASVMPLHEALYYLSYQADSARLQRKLAKTK
jgi:hypothetical protein